MKRITVLLICFLTVAVVTVAADLSTATSQDLIAIYKQLRTLQDVESQASWYPSFGAHDDRTQYEIHARSPKKFKFIGAGIQTASEKQKDSLVTSWKSDIPLTVAGFNYGSFVEAERSAPDLIVTAYSGTDIPDALNGIQSGLSVAQLGRMTNRDVEAGSGIALGGFNTSRSVKATADVSFQALQFFQFYFGALPFKAVSVSEQPIPGSRSWPYLISLSYDMFLDSTTRNSLHK